MTAAAVAVLLAAAWFPGRLVTRHLSLDEFSLYERLALTFTAGIGLVALLLAMLAVAGRFAAAPFALAALSVFGLLWGRASARPTPASALPSRGLATRSTANETALRVVLTAAVFGGCLGALAPVTDDDALAYVVPIAQRIADRGVLAAWPDQARAMWPLSQEVLLAWMLRCGATRLGALTAIEWLLCLGVFSALARVVCATRDGRVMALVLAFGSPAIAFQVASAKEDLLLLAASMAAVLSVTRAARDADFVAAGVFAGLAAGTKYSGAAVVLAVVVCALLVDGPPARRLRRAVLVAVCAALAGGFWYGLNAWRFANPVAPLLAGARGTPLDGAAARSWMDAFGAPRTLVNLVCAPFDIFARPELYAGRGNLFNPLVYAALAALPVAAWRARARGVLVVAAIFYVVWYATLRNARLLLPAAAFLAAPAGDALAALGSRAAPLRRLVWSAGLAALAIVPAVGVVRAVRLVQDPATYLARETQRYADIAWMNAHLDPARHRVASRVKVLGYLRVPSLVLDASYQFEISDRDLDTAASTLAACRRQRITHLFGEIHEFDEMRGDLRLIYENPASRLGGVRFFRPPPTEHTAVFEIE